MLRFVKTILATCGFLLAACLVFFSFFPLHSYPKNKLTLKQLTECDEHSLELNNSSLESNQELISFESYVDSSDAVENIVQYKNYLDTFAHKVNASLKTTLSFCLFTNNPDITLEMLEQKLSNFRGSFYYGNGNRFIGQINEIPFIQKSNIETQLNMPLLFARSNPCNRPINMSDMYFLTLLKKEQNTGVVMVNFEMQKDKKRTSIEKEAISNLLVTGQYFKEKVSCNET